MKISIKLYAGFIIVVALTAALGLYISYMNGKSLTEDAGRDAVFQAEEIIKGLDRAIYDKAMEVGAGSAGAMAGSRAACGIDGLSTPAGGGGAKRVIVARPAA